MFCRCVPHLSGKPHEPCRRAGKGQKLSAILVCGSACRYDLLVKVVSTKKLKPTQHDLLMGQFVKHELWERRVVAAWLNLLYAGLDKQTYAPEQGSAISKLSRFTDEVWLPDEWRPCRGGN